MALKATAAMWRAPVASDRAEKIRSVPVFGVAVNQHPGCASLDAVQKKPKPRPRASGAACPMARPPSIALRNLEAALENRAGIR